MSSLPFILIIAFILSLILSFLSLTTKRKAMEIVDDMGIGWNIGNTFDSYSLNKNITDPDEQITLWGNIIPTKDLFVKIKKYGFKTIRFPITWMHFMNETGIINNVWLLRIKEVIDWIINLNMYCIINIHHDATFPNWLTKGEEPKEKFIFLWKQIAEEFKDYDDHLIFECMNDVQYSGDNNNYNYTLLSIFNQEFVNVIRDSNSDNNKERLLILSGANKELDLTCSKDYKLPIDPYNKFAISIHYYLPSKFTVEHDDNPWTYIDDNGDVQIVNPMIKWGTDNDYKEMITNFETLKKTYVDKDIPIVITETGVLTEQKKELESIRKYLYAEFSMSGSYNGIMSCLWDNSNKEKGDTNFFDRINNKFYDEMIGDNFKKISRGKFVKPTDYYISSKIDTVYMTNSEGYLEIKIGTKKVLKVIFNVNILIHELNLVGFGIASNDKSGNWIGDQVDGTKGKRQYDGSYTYTFDSSNKDYNNFVQIQKWWGHDNIILNYLSLEFDKNYTILDFNSYKEALY